MPDVTAEQVDAADAALRVAKDAGDPVAAQNAAEALASIRSAWRRQEETAGRRGMVGGDATSEGN